MTSRMNEEKAIAELKKVREYYSMNRQGYDDVIKWLEGRIKRRSKKCETPKCKQQAKLVVFRGHEFMLCEEHFIELKEKAPK